jgi:hypothetical protein
MNTRRDFFRWLSIIPVALLGIRFGLQTFRLPVGCDLSFTALQWAVVEGLQRNFGHAKRLIIGPENIFSARELLGRSGDKEWTCCLDPDPVIQKLKEEYLTYEVRRDIPMNTWSVEFERGVVESQGP